MQAIAKTLYLAKTPELQVFLRPQGKCEECLRNLERTNTDKVIKHYKRHVRFNNDNTTESNLRVYTDTIQAFVVEQRELMKQLKNFTSYIDTIVPLKQQQIKYYNNFG
jgi:hypothetical protein